MTEESAAIEVGADELSDEAVRGMIEEGDLDRDTAERFGEEVWFDELELEETEETTVTEHLRSRYDLVPSSDLDLPSIRSKTAYAEVVSVVRGSDSVIEVNVRTPDSGIQTISFDPDSKALSNLLKYKGLHNPKDLEGAKILLNLNSSRSTLLLPHNVSMSGRLRYRLYSIVSEIDEKTRANNVYDLGEKIIKLSAFSVLLSAFLSALSYTVFGSTILDILPIAVFGLLVTFSAFFGAYRVFLSVILAAFKSDFIEK